MLTSYDSMTAGLFEQAGVKVLLVGDTAGMVIFGHETTLPVSLDQMLPLAQGVVRGTKNALVVGDMPFGSYQASPEQAVISASRYMKEAGTHAVKLEGGVHMVPQVEALTAAGIPVMGHLGLTPQSVHAIGGMLVQGRGEAGDRLVDAAKALEAAGAFAVVLEAVPTELGKRITESITIPTVGIGAGPHTDAQVLVWQDMAGLTQGHKPKFVKQYADMHSVLTEATRSFVDDVETGSFPDENYSY